MSPAPRISEWAQLILERRPRPARDWSLCEVRLTAEEFASLRAWGQNLSLTQFSSYCQSSTCLTITGQSYHGRAVLGLVLFLLESETARRHATEGMVWPCIHNLGWTEGVCSRLFNSTGGATALHRLLLQDAAETFNLRHLFGQEGVHSWIDSIFLQFGFTIRGALNRLGTWLHNPQLPVAVTQLLHSASSSPEFTNLWSCLRKISREKRLCESQRRLLENSQWILPEWIEDLLAAAMRAQAPSQDWPDEPGEARIVQAVRLVQTQLGENGGYAFEVNLSDQNVLDLTEPSYRILWNNEVVGLLHLDKGIYRLSGEKLILPATRPDGDLALQAPSSAEPAFRQRLELWNSNDIVTVFSARGSRLEDDCHGSLRTGFHLIYHSCVLLRGQVQSQASLSDFWCCATAVSPTKDVQLCTDEGELLWDSSWVSADSSASACSGLHAHWVPLNGKTFEEGNRAEIRLSLPKGFTLISAHFNGRRVATGQMPQPLGQLEVVLESSDFVQPPRLRVAVQVGANRYSVVLPMESLWVKAVFMESPEGKVIRCPVDSPLRSGEARASKFKFPQLWESAMKPVLMEGHRVVATIDPDRTQRLSGLSGYGAPLTMVRDRFNAHATQSRFTVACKVRNTDGLLRSIKDTGGEISLWLYHDRQLSPEDSVLLLDSTGMWHSVPAANIVAKSPRQWTIPLEHRGMPPVVCAALLYKETAIGAWQHPTEFRQLLATLNQPEQIRAFAAAIRAFKLPFLETCSQRVYRAWVSKNLPAVLAVWLRPFNITLGSSYLNMGHPDDVWLEAVQEFFATSLMEPSADDAKTLVCSVADVHPSTLNTIETCFGPVADALRILTEISPWLATHTVREVLKGCQIPAGEQSRVRLQLAHLNDCPSDVWAQCSLNMQVDDGFWSRTAFEAAKHGEHGMQLEGADAWNVSVALKTPAFRRRVSTLILKMAV